MHYLKIRDFYNKLEDEESRLIFRYRLNYLFTGDRKYLTDMTIDVNRLFHPAKIIRNIDVLPGNTNLHKHGAVIYSMGENTEYCVKLLRENRIHIHAICDVLYQNWQPDGYLGIPVISPEELYNDIQYKRHAIVMSNADWQQVNCDALINKGFSYESIFVLEGQYNFTNYPYKPFYYEQEFIKLTDNETYVDAGCFNGNTIKQFNGACKGIYNKIYGFEPHAANYGKTVKVIEELGLINTHIFQKGVWSTEGTKPFITDYGDGAGAGARIIDHGQNIIQTTSLDIALSGENITFIKMDIEGAELEALKGATETIKRCKPKLAVCIYHKAEDIIEIPMFLYDLVPEYKFYIRHSNCIRDFGNPAHDTVLYAII
jgi:FkbM family methyltransferase